MEIGVDDNQGFVYEGRGQWGHALWPAPTVSFAKFGFSSNDQLEAEDRRVLVGEGHVFREDSYDPTSRIRRGRFYQAGNGQPLEWHVQPHPAVPRENHNTHDGTLKKRLDTYFGQPFRTMLPERIGDQLLVLLGFKDRFTIWKVVDVEAITTGEDLVTLKSHSSLGILPVIRTEEIPVEYQATITESLELLVDEVGRASAASVVDRAREAITHLSLAYLNKTPETAVDLAKLAIELGDTDHPIAGWAARIVGRLHGRAKAVEQMKRDVRPLKKEDAELATLCVGTVLCELRWAEWP